MHETTDRIPIGHMVKQSDIMYPKLSITVLESAFKQLNGDKKRINIGEQYLNNLRFASNSFGEIKVILKTYKRCVVDSYVYMEAIKFAT